MATPRSVPTTNPMAARNKTEPSERNLRSGLAGRIGAGTFGISSAPTHFQHSLNWSWCDSPQFGHVHISLLLGRATGFIPVVQVAARDYYHGDKPRGSQDHG